MEVLDAGTKNLPPAARLHTLLGVLLARAEQRGQAAVAFQRAEQLTPATSFGRVGLAVTLLEAGAVDLSHLSK